MALDSILSTAIIPPPPKSTGNSTSPPASTGPASAPASDSTPAVANNPTNATGRRSADHASSDADRGSSHRTHDTSESPSNSKPTNKRPTRSNDSNGARTHANASSRSKPHSSQRAKQTQDTKAASAQQRAGKGSSFVDALAQSQADAAANADATAGATTGAISDTSGKPKDGRNDATGDVTAASLAFIPQSVAAAIAAAAQAPAQGQPNAPASTDSVEEDPLAALTANGKSGAQATALIEGEKDLTATTAAAGGSKADTAQGTSPQSAAPDGSNAAAVAFQAHLGISSHFQQPPTAAMNGNKVEAPVGTPAFNDELGGKITWLANQGVQSASLQLSPEHLGPVNVHISVQDGSASVSFNAVHPDTRAALEQALPRLREMFSTQGLTLTDANVSHQSPRGQPQRQSVGSVSAIGAARDESSATSITSALSARLGLVDTYA